MYSTEELWHHQKELERQVKLYDYELTSNEQALDVWFNTATQPNGLKCYQTGYKDLDLRLDGGLYPGLYCIGAISSLGKTTYILQMADQVAAQGNDVLIFSLEMSRNELIAKSLSRLTFEINPHRAKTVRQLQRLEGLDAMKDKDIILESKQRYKEFAKRIYILEGSGNITTEHIRQAVQNHVWLTGNKPLVVVDYLQIIAPHSDRMSEKANIDRNVSELKRISRDFDLPLIAISSFSRQAYNTSATMASFKESGSIEYSADILMALQLHGVGTSNFDMDEAKSEMNRKVELLILKNRNGDLGKPLAYNFNAKFNTYRESYFK